MLATRLFFWWSSVFGGGPVEIWVQTVVGSAPGAMSVTGGQARLVAVVGEA